jgi:hypothetical protein
VKGTALDRDCAREGSLLHGLKRSMAPTPASERKR